MYAIRFILTFTVLSGIVGLYALAGLEPSAWTVAVIVALSLFIAAMTAPEKLK